MREDSQSNGGKIVHLHWHNGGTCHGHPTPEACAKSAIAAGWTGKILEREDVYPDGTAVKCYSLIASDFDHYAKQGQFVAEVGVAVAVYEAP